MFNKYCDDFENPEGGNQNSPRFMEQVLICLEAREMSLHTQRAYCRWILEFTRFHQMRHPRQLGHKNVSEFLDYLAGSLRLALATRHQALNALIFLYRRVLKRNVRGWHRNLQPPSKKEGRNLWWRRARIRQGPTRR